MNAIKSNLNKDDIRKHFEEVEISSLRMGIKNL